MPSTLDRARISSILTEPRHQLLKFDIEINQLEDALLSVKQKRDTLQDSIQQHHTLLTPFRCLPDDTLQEVFGHCLPDDHNAIMSIVEAPLLLGRVCSRWRTVAYHTPCLWATLHIPVPIPPYLPRHHPNYRPAVRAMQETFQAKVRSHMDAVEAWLSRSGTCPLSLSFNGVEDKATRGYPRTYLGILLQHVHRWEHIKLTVPPVEDPPFLTLVPSQDFPELTHLELKIKPYPPVNGWVNSGLLNAPKLSYLRIPFLPTAMSESSLEVSWQNITHLSIDEVYSSSLLMKPLTLEDAHTLLRKCPSLNHCSFKLMDSSDALSPKESVLLPHLVSFSVVDSAPRVESLFECLRVPSLRKISYHSTYAPSIRPSPLINFISRLDDQIQCLVIDLHIITLGDLMDIFTFTSSLTHFTHLDMAPSREQAFIRKRLPTSPHLLRVLVNLLTPGYNGENYWPRLRFFRLRGGPSWIPEEDVLQFIQGRMAAAVVTGSSKLENVMISPTWCKNSIDIRSHLAMYLEDGLKFDIVYADPDKSMAGGAITARSGMVRRNIERRGSLYLEG